MGAAGRDFHNFNVVHRALARTTTASTRAPRGRGSEHSSTTGALRAEASEDRTVGVIEITGAAAHGRVRRHCDHTPSSARVRM